MLKYDFKNETMMFGFPVFLYFNYAVNGINERYLADGYRVVYIDITCILVSFSNFVKADQK